MTDAPTPLVSATWLAQHLDAPDVVVLDCRFALSDANLGHHKYLAGHIPGAFYLHLNRDLSRPVEQYGGRHPLPEPETFAAKLGAMGINSSNTWVVVYDDSKLAFASRCWWLLRYLGHDRVSVLDGGLTEWQACGYPLTSELPEPQPGFFTPRVQWQQVVDYNTVKTRKDEPGVVLVDSRDPERYRGEREPIDPVAGHIPGAVNYPWHAVTNDRSLALAPEVQRDRWKEIADAEEIFVYCGSGVTACVNLLSLELAGIDSGRLYAGSWSDWILHP